MAYVATALINSGFTARFAIRLLPADGGQSHAHGRAGRWCCRICRPPGAFVIGHDNCEGGASRSIQSIHNAAKYFDLHHMQVDKELNAMFSSKEITTIAKYLATKFAIAALVVVLGMVGSAAASTGPKPTVISSDPADDAINVPVNTTVTVNFSLPMDCH